MSAREWQVGLAGTFDVENYGDLLFPLLAEAELSERLGPLRLHCFSYETKTADGWPFPVTSVTELPRIARDLDALIVGGGFLVRFDKDVAPGYGPPLGIHHPTGYWLSPALIALQHDVPVLWNAPGVLYESLPAWADPLMELAFSQSAYIAVRDEPSREALSRFVGRDRISVVPDTAFGLGRRLASPPSREARRLLEAAGLTGPYVVLQGARNLGSFQRFLKRYSSQIGELRFLALPIGPANRDDTAVLDHDLPGLVTLPSWPHPLLLAEILRQAEAVVGSSFHLAITALTAGVPVFSPVDLSSGKYPGLAGFETIRPLPGNASDASDTADTADTGDPAAFFSRLGRTAVLPQVEAAAARVGEHWDRMADILRARREASVDTHLAVGRFWQSLPGVLEAAAVRREAEIALRERRIADLEGSTSWKVTAPLRSIGRRIGR